MWVFWIDGGAGVLGLGLLGWIGLRLWRQVRSLTKTVSSASASIAELTAGLELLAPPSRNQGR